MYKVSCSSYKFKVGDNVLINIYRQNHNDILDKYGIDYKKLCDDINAPRTKFHHRSGKVVNVSSIHNNTGEHTVYILDITHETCFLSDELMLIQKPTALEPLKGSDPITPCNIPISSTGVYIPSMPNPIIGASKRTNDVTLPSPVSSREYPNDDTEDGLMMCVWRPFVPVKVEPPCESIDNAVSLMNTYCIIMNGVYVNA